jgi:hypothetical protein
VQNVLLPLAGTDSYSGLVADGDTLLTSHFTGTDQLGSRARFYIDRFDVSDPSAPKRGASLNVPGALLQYDRASGRALTTEQVRTVVPNLTWTDCYARFAYADFVSNDSMGGSAPIATSGGASSGSGGASGSDVASPTPVTPDPVPEPKGVCTGYRQHLHLVSLGESGAHLEDSLVLDENQQLTASSLGDGVVFATLGHDGYPYGRGVLIADCFGPCGVPQTADPTELLVLGGFDKGKFEVGHIRVEDSKNSTNAWWGFWGVPTVYAFGDQALLIGQSDIAVIDASTPSAPKLARQLPLIATPQYVDLRGDQALLTLGTQGVQWLSLK